MILIILAGVFLLANGKTNKLEELPKPEITGGERGELGIDKNINETTIDNYLNRQDAVYRDMRMLEDPGNYENIGGDRFLSGYIEGFEVIPLPYIIPVTDLPTAVGDTYTGTTLFYEDNGIYVANYEESMNILETIFPKDKVIFLMCGGGGYAGMTKNLLVALGWDENKIYNVGGYWYYEGTHSINVKQEVDGVISYDFDNVPYHNIEFDKLTKSTNYKIPVTKVTEVKISTSNMELEEGTSFKLNAIVLPNEATNKEVKWSSSNEEIATVTDDGLVSAVGVGYTYILVKSVDGEQSAYCYITVNKSQLDTSIKLDDIATEVAEFSSYDYQKMAEEFGYYSDQYYQTFRKRINIINKLTDEKKSFIILIHQKQCTEREYSVVDGAEKLLKQNNYSYLEVGSPTYDDDKTLSHSKLIGVYEPNFDEYYHNYDKIGSSSVVIVINGEIYASIDPDSTSIKSDEELKNWLSKYIDIN